MKRNFVEPFIDCGWDVEYLDKWVTDCLLMKSFASSQSRWRKPMQQWEILPFRKIPSAFRFLRELRLLWRMGTLANGVSRMDCNIHFISYCPSLAFSVRYISSFGSFVANDIIDFHLIFQFRYSNLSFVAPAPLLFLLLPIAQFKATNPATAKNLTIATFKVFLSFFFIFLIEMVTLWDATL